MPPPSLSTSGALCLSPFYQTCSVWQVAWYQWAWLPPTLSLSMQECATIRQSWSSKRMLQSRGNSNQIINDACNSEDTSTATRPNHCIYITHDDMQRRLPMHCRIAAAIWQREMLQHTPEWTGMARQTSCFVMSWLKAETSVILRALNPSNKQRSSKQKWREKIQWVRRCRNSGILVEKVR